MLRGNAVRERQGVRQYPSKAGSFDCKPSNAITFEAALNNWIVEGASREP